MGGGHQGLLLVAAVVQSRSHVQLLTSWTAARQASLSFTVSLSLLRLMSIESVMPSNHLILCYSLLLLPSTFPSIRVFSNESALCFRWPEYWSFSFSTSNEYSGLISFRIDYFDLLAVQGTLKASWRGWYLSGVKFWISREESSSHAKGGRRELGKTTWMEKEAHQSREDERMR